LTFGKPEFNSTDNCEYLKDYLVKISLLLILKEQGRAEFKKIIGNCLGHIPKDLERVAYFPYLGDLSGVKSYLVDNQFSSQKRFKIQSFYKQAHIVKNEKKVIVELLTYGLDDERFKDPFDRLKYKKKVESISINFWRNLFSLNLALASKNTPWLTQLVQSLGQTSPHLFLISGLNLHSDERRMVRDYILELLEKLVDRKVSSERIKILARKVSQLGKTEEFGEIGNELDANWSLTELRGLFQNPLWKEEYFDFWYSLIVDRTSQAEVDGKLRNVLSPTLVEKIPFSQMWIFEYYLPPDEKVRNALYKRLKYKWEKGSLLESYQVLEILEMAPVKTHLSKEVSDLNRATFQLSREFFIRLLNSGNSTHYALYQLYRLGDKQSDHLWWLIL